MEGALCGRSSPCVFSQMLQVLQGRSPVTGRDLRPKQVLGLAPVVVNGELGAEPTSHDSGGLGAHL